MLWNWQGEEDSPVVPELECTCCSIKITQDVREYAMALGMESIYVIDGRDGCIETRREHRPVLPPLHIVKGSSYGRMVTCRTLSARSASIRRSKGSRLM
jgi:hypothetical protein